MTMTCLIALAPAFAQAKDRQLVLYTTTHPAMGTTYTLYLYSDDPERADTISSEVFDEVDRIDQLLSNYRESSEISRINREAATAPVTTDPEMFEFLQQSLHWSQASDGAFDITVGRLMKSWGFFRHEGRIPAEAELTALRSVTGWQHVQLDPNTRTVTFNSSIELDPGGIGKGFAVDAAVRVLRADHVTAAMISAGSSTIYALGAPPGARGWRVVVPGPLPSQRTLSTITLRDTSLSSSDCTQKNFILDNHLYCHIMDPHTLSPVEGRIQVTILHPSATASDALSNVLFVQSPARSTATLATYAPAAQALIVSTGKAGPICTTFRWPTAVDSSHCKLAQKQIRQSSTQGKP